MITDRIKEIMEAESLTPARFADLLDVGRAVISHILNGRNNPSLDVITRILSKLPNISSEWLLTGNGNMYKGSNNDENEKNKQNTSYMPDLFSQESPKTIGALNNIGNEPPQNLMNRPADRDEKKYLKEKQVNVSKIIPQRQLNQRVKYKEIGDKRIKQIIIYYSDNTFETFAPE